MADFAKSRTSRFVLQAEIGLSAAPGRVE